MDGNVNIIHLIYIHTRRVQLVLSFVFLYYTYRRILLKLLGYYIYRFISICIRIHAHWQLSNCIFVRCRFPALQSYRVLVCSGENQLASASRRIGATSRRQTSVDIALIVLIFDITAS